MSETNQVQQEISEEDRVIAMFGLDGAEEQDTQDQGDADAEEQAEQAASPDEESDQTETEDEGDEARPAPIDPPTFWAKEAKEQWDAIPPSIQGYLVQREAERSAEVERAQRDSAESRRQAQQLAGEIAQERVYLNQHLVPAIQEVTRRLTGDYSPESMAELARTNPAERAAKVAERDKMVAMHAALDAEQKRTDAMALQGELARLAEAAPELRSQDGQKAMAEWASHAQHHGFTPQELAMVKDHRVFLVLRELDQTKRELAALKSAKEAPVKKAVQTVVSRQPTNANRPRQDSAPREMGRRQIMEAARSRDASAQEAAVAAMFNLRG